MNALPNASPSSDRNTFEADLPSSITSAHIDALIKDVHYVNETHWFNTEGSNLHILHIGAGNGSVLDQLVTKISETVPNSLPGSRHEKAMKTAIEISEKHHADYPSKNIKLIGTDLFETNLISKKAHIALCHPPLGLHGSWISTVLSYLNFQLFYAILPDGYHEDPSIADTIARRKLAAPYIVATFPSDAGNLALVRFSPTPVEVRKIEIAKGKNQDDRRSWIGSYNDRYLDHLAIDPFETFAQNELGISLSEDSHNTTEDPFDPRKVPQRKPDDVPLLDALVENKSASGNAILENYRKIGGLDPSLFEELKINPHRLVHKLKEKLEKLDRDHWETLFENLQAITDRLSAEHRRALLYHMSDAEMDFNRRNALYVVKNALPLAEEMIRETVTDVFTQMTDSKSVLRTYKTNAHVHTDNWRYANTSDPEGAKYILDRKFVMYLGHTFGDIWGNKTTLSKKAEDFVNDLSVVMTSLGYQDVIANLEDTPWLNFQNVVPGNKIIIYGSHPNEPNGHKTLVEIKPYKNGNVHLRFNKLAMTRLNVTASRLLGWVRDKREFEEETDIDVPEGVWSTSDRMRIDPSSLLAIVDGTQ